MIQVQLQVTTASTCTYILLNGQYIHLTDGFGSSQENALSLMGLIPAFITNDAATLQPAVELHSELLLSEYEFRSEFTIWKHKWEWHEEAAEIKTAVAALKSCQGDTLPNIKTLLQIFATLPVSTAQPERVFSKLERTATAIRSMADDRVEVLVLMQSHLDQ